MMKGQAIGLLAVLVLMSFLAREGLSASSEPKRDWELVNPEGIVQLKPTEVNPHPASLEGKTVALRWNGKQNGNHFLDRVAELLTQQVKGIKIVKLYEREVSMNRLSGPPYGTVEDPIKFAKKIAEYKPDLVIGSQAD
jgi:hypothetical protein